MFQLPLPILNQRISMTNKFSDIIYVDTPYRPEIGSFCKPKSVDDDRYKTEHWYHCRDLIHAQLYNLNLFFFSHESSKGRCIATFMQKTEEILNVQPRSVFGQTQRKTIMWIKPSRWWTIKAMRRSLFTILLRAGSHYCPNKDNFEESIFSDPYAKNTKYAIERFFAGNTVYTGRRRGWHNQFHEYKPTDKEIDALLVKP